MDKGVPSSLFVNDGSFMERFKQLHQEKDDRSAVQDSRPKTNTPRSLAPIIKTGDIRPSTHMRKTAIVPSGGKLAFSLKQKSKLVTPAVKLSEDDDEDETDGGSASEGVSAKRQKMGQADAHDVPTRKLDVGNVWKYILCSILIVGVCSSQCICWQWMSIYMDFLQLSHVLCHRVSLSSQCAYYCHCTPPTHAHIHTHVL